MGMAGTVPVSPWLKAASPHVFQTQTGKILTRPPPRASLTPWTSTRCCGRHSAACRGSGRRGGAPAPTFILKYKRQKKYGEREREMGFLRKRKRKKRNLFYNQYLRRTGHLPLTGGALVSGSPRLAPAM